MTPAERLAAFTLRGALGLFGATVSSRLSILIFHRVNAVPDPLVPYEPDAARFEAMMRFVAASFRVMTFGEAARHLAQDSLPPRSLVVTFDDGYADNAEIALPILQKLGLKATIFVAPGFLDGGRMWNDSVIECLRVCELDHVDLDCFSLPRLPLGTLAERRKAIGTLLPQLKYLAPSERTAAVEELQRRCRVGNLPRDLMMTTAQLRAVHAAEMEIGAHTLNHPILTSVSAEEAGFEIAEGRRQLQTTLDAPIEVFAYPNGKPDRDYDASHVAMVRSQGFIGAVSTAPGVGRTGDDLHQLPRFTPWGRSLTVWGARLAMNQANTGFRTAARGVIVP